VLDIGAGTGRNAIALARHGYATDAVELSPKFAEQMRNTAAALNLTNIRVLDSDAFAEGIDLRDDYRMIVASEVVTDFRNTAQLHALFELAAKRLLPGGLLVFSAFLARSGYTPTPVVRELAQHFMCSFFTADEMAQAAAGLPLELIADDSVYDYERAHLAADAWPPTKWYESWTTGRDAFPGARDASPIDLRWLVYRAY
jgi:SAM-dependent methyltransferase